MKAASYAAVEQSETECKQGGAKQSKALTTGQVMAGLFLGVAQQSIERGRLATLYREHDSEVMESDEKSLMHCYQHNLLIYGDLVSDPGEPLFWLLLVWRCAVFSHSAFPSSRSGALDLPVGSIS